MQVNKQAEINPTIIKIVSVKISESMTMLQDEKKYYTIECSNGTTATKQFDSYQAAWDWGLKFCAYN